MIDLHSHILPGQDDGAQSLEESLAMARIAVESGVTVVAATPHCAENRMREIQASWYLLKEALEDSELPLELVLGMEIFGTPETARMLREGKLLTLNGSRYPLIEFPFRSDGAEETWILNSVCKAGYRPVIAHPERYSCVQRDPMVVNEWYRMGCLFQVNRGSFQGRFGHGAQNMAFDLVDRGFATVVASDAHSPRIRTPWMADVEKMLAADFSAAYARMLLTDNPGAILKNQEIQSAEPDWFE